jgi:cytidine deaminase
MYDKNMLLDTALVARANAYAPYSKFKVGAAILLDNGKYILGCNVENASYGLSNCAERTALFKMISDGYTKNNVIAMAIVGDTLDVISPCGACRQVMIELLKPDCPILLCNLKRDMKEYKVIDLLPYAFSEKDL